MVIRCWEGTARVDNGDAYLAYLTEVMVPRIRALPGCRGVQVLRRVGAEDGFVVQSYWTDADAIARFAGADSEHAVVPEAARALLADFEERARHFEVVLDVPADDAHAQVQPAG
jgi:heme-degrading monooxygenase HmoA